jgi:hypothetical protein
LDWAVPAFSTVCRRQKTLQVELSCQRTKTPLQLLVDSTGIKFLGEGEWKRKKHGAEYRREWRKVHLGIDAQTLEIRAIEVTSNAIGDAPIPPTSSSKASVRRRLRHARLPGRHRRTASDGGDPAAPERQPFEEVESGLGVPQRGHSRVRALGSQHLEEVARLPPAQPCADEDALL